MHNGYSDNIMRYSRRLDKSAGLAYQNCEYVGWFVWKKIYRCDIQCTGRKWY